MSRYNVDQIMCLIAYEGSRTMNAFDRLPPMVRERLRNSPFNLCAACVIDFYQAGGGDYLSFITKMEELLRE